MSLSLSLPQVFRPMDTLRGEHLVMSASESRDYELVVHNHPLLLPQSLLFVFVCTSIILIRLNSSLGILIFDRSGYWCIFGTQVWEHSYPTEVTIVVRVV